jgi:hypothetical protein
MFYGRICTTKRYPLVDRRNTRKILINLGDQRTFILLLTFFKTSKKRNDFEKKNDIGTQVPTPNIYT